MNRRFCNFYVFAALLGSVLFMEACQSEGGDCKEIPPLFSFSDGAPEISKKFLSKYMSATSSGVLGGVSQGQGIDDVCIFVDKSSGINEAFSSANSREASEILTRIVGNYTSAKYFSVLGEIQQEDPIGAKTNYYSNPKNYHPTEMARLENALNKIVENSGLSFFITDGEEFDSRGEEANSETWAQVAMEKWIKRGGAIHFWITDFEVKSKFNGVITKHLYFMAFVPAHMANDNSFQNTVKSLNGVCPKHLELSNISWRILDAPWSQQSTGLDPNLLQEGVFEKNLYVRDFNNPSGSYEFISLQYPLSAELFKTEDFLKSKQFYRGLKIDLSNNKFFDVNTVNIKVTDVSNDLNRFSKYNEITLNTPNTAKDKSTNKTILDPNDPYACYFDLENDKPVIKPQEKYPLDSDEPSSLLELFEFDNDIFANSRKDNLSKVELGFRIHRNFNETDKSLINELGYNIVRVDFQVVDFKKKSISELQYFTWKSMYKAADNTGLSRSIENVILSTQAKDKIVHTLFIKFIKEN